jgi:hypothetical protein
VLILKKALETLEREDTPFSENTDIDDIDDPETDIEETAETESTESNSNKQKKRKKPAKKAKKRQKSSFFERPDLITAEAIFLFYTLTFAVVHVLLLLLAIFTGAYFAAFYQAIPICWYVYLYVIKSRAFDSQIYNITVFEMLANAFVCTVFIGGGYGFFTYLLIIPANSYFMSYHMRKNNLGTIHPIVPTVIALLAAIGLRLADGHFG